MVRAESVGPSDSPRRPAPARPGSADRVSRPGQPPSRLQPFARVPEHLVPLAEREAHLTAARLRVVVEHRTRHRHHTAALRQRPAEGERVLLAEGGDVGGDEVRALRLVHGESGGAQASVEQVALAQQIGPQGGEVAVREPQGLGDGVLERSRAHIGQILLRRADRRDQGRGAGDPADLPSRERVRLARRRDGDGALAHSGQRRDGAVGAFVDQVFVHLVGDHEQVVFDGESGDGTPLVIGQDHAGGVVRRVEQQHPGAGCDGVPQRVEVGAEVRGAEGQRYADGARHGDAGGVRVVERLEGDHLVARLQQGEHRGGDGLRGPRGDQHLRVGVETDAVEAPLVVGDRRAEFRDARTRRVLVAAAVAQRPDRRLADFRRAVGVRETLPQIDRAGGRGQRGHLREDRRAESVQPHG